MQFICQHPEEGPDGPPKNDLGKEVTAGGFGASGFDVPTKPYLPILSAGTKALLGEGEGDPELDALIDSLFTKTPPRATVPARDEGVDHKADTAIPVYLSPEDIALQHEVELILKQNAQAVLATLRQVKDDGKLPDFIDNKLLEIGILFSTDGKSEAVKQLEELYASLQVISAPLGVRIDVLEQLVECSERLNILGVEILQLNLARLFIEAGKDEKAKEVVFEILAKRPEHQEALLILQQLQNGQNKFNKKPNSEK